jgi:hypothetical protein
MEALARLSGCLLSQAVGALAGGASPAPTLALERDAGRELQRFSDDDLIRAVADARDALRQKLLEARRAALLIPSEAGADCLTVEGAELGEPVLELKVRLRYGRGEEGLSLDEPSFEFPSTVDAAGRRACLSAFEAGVREDEAGARAWAAGRTAR